jgi:Ca-activated chloride channel homolog
MTTMPPSVHQDPPVIGTLTTVRGNLPLTDMDVHADLVGLAAAIRVRQTFHNPHATPIEATYVFPLPDRAALTDFTVTIGDRRITGVLQERQAARAAYDAAIDRGQQAAIVEEERPDVFTTRVGNLAPGEHAIVELTLAGRLSCDAGQATFQFPLVVAPRYVPGQPLEGESVGDGTTVDTDAVPDASRISPPVLLAGFSQPVRLSLSVNLDPAGLSISGLTSSLHAVRVSGGLPGPVTVKVRPGERLNRDFILRFRIGDDDRPLVSAVAVADAAGDEGTYVVTVQSPQAPTPPPRDVIILLDRSGSMQGWKMVAARRAAARIVDSLSSIDRFTVLAFDNVLEHPDEGNLLPASDRRRYQAVEWLSRLEARGGTEMLPAVERALALVSCATDHLSRRAATVVLVTDGQVGNEDQLVRAVASGRSVRWFTVGIDQAVNAGLLRRLAAAGAGRCDLVESEDRLDEVMIELHRRIGNPALEDVMVEVDGAIPGTVTPARADVFPGAPLVISGRFSGRPPLRVRVGASDFVGEAPVRPSGSQALSALWARAHLRDLEDRYAAGAADADLGELARRMAAVSIRHRVLCRFTAFIAVDEEGKPVDGELHRITQPVEQPAGWAGGPQRFAGVQLLTAHSGQDGAIGPPVTVPGIPAHSPAMPPGSGGRIRMARASSAAGPVEVTSPGSWPTDIDLGEYRSRIEELLEELSEELLEELSEEIDRLDSMDVATLVRNVRRLAEDLQSVGLHGPVVEALVALAEALTAGDRRAVAARAADLKATAARPAPVGPPRRQQPFWR